MSAPVTYFNNVPDTGQLSLLSLSGEPLIAMQYAHDGDLPWFSSYGKGFVPLPTWGLEITDCLLASIPGLPEIEGMDSVVLKNSNRPVKYDGFFVEGPRTYWQPVDGQEVPHQMYVAWGGITKVFERSLYTPLPEPWTIWTAHGAKGVLIGQAKVDGVQHTRFTFITKIIRRKSEGYTENRIDLSFRHVDLVDCKWPPTGMTGHWFSILKRALQGFETHCEPSNTGSKLPYWATANQEFDALFLSTLAECESWQQALTQVSSPWELMSACKHFGPTSGFTGTPYKRIKRMVEAFIADNKNKQGALVRTMWPFAQRRLREV